MKMRAERVADVIQAPTLKDTAADVMIKANPIISDANALKEEEIRQLKIKEASLDNMTRHQMQQVEQRKNTYELQSPGRRQPSPSQEPMDYVS